ncbi:MAG TPA: hypothetical protein VNX28_08525 [Gemmataceae bacterium]|nr:hypothetical protein [Gemmataceae bacterium]
MARAKQALASLPWVDQKNVQADVTKQEVRFGVSDMAKFDETQIKDAFKKKNFDKVEVLARPKS